MIIGQVQHISVEKEYAQGYEQRYGKDGFRKAYKNLYGGINEYENIYCVSARH